MAAAEAFTDLLGVPEVETPAERIHQLRQGLAYEAVESLQEKLGLSADELARSVAISTRTLARRKEEGRLKLDESDRVARIARVLQHAVKVLGTTEKAAAWMKRSHPTLDGMRPLEVFDTDLGAQLVEEVLTRIEYGIYS